MFPEPNLDVRYGKNLQERYQYAYFKQNAQGESITQWRHCVVCNTEDHQPQKKNFDLTPNFNSSHKAHAQKHFFTSFQTSFCCSSIGLAHICFHVARNLDVTGSNSYSLVHWE